MRKDPKNKRSEGFAVEIVRGQLAALTRELERASRRLNKALTVSEVDVVHREVRSALSHLEAGAVACERVEHSVLHLTRQCVSLREDLNRQLTRLNPEPLIDVPFPEGWMGLPSQPPQEGGRKKE